MKFYHSWTKTMKIKPHKNYPLQSIVSWVSIQSSMGTGPDFCYNDTGPLSVETHPQVATPANVRCTGRCGHLENHKSLLTWNPLSSWYNKQLWGRNNISQTLMINNAYGRACTTKSQHPSPSVWDPGLNFTWDYNCVMIVCIMSSSGGKYRKCTLSDVHGYMYMCVYVLGNRVLSVLCTPAL